MREREGRRDRTLGPLSLQFTRTSPPLQTSSTNFEPLVGREPPASVLDDALTRGSRAKPSGLANPAEAAATKAALVDPLDRTDDRGG